MSATCPSARPTVAVYGIARDEAPRVERWARSAREADVVLLGDTGSDDETIVRARGAGVDVRQVPVTPFRFDAARNRTLALVPHEIDVCVSLDLDEVLEPGWRTHLDEAWRGDLDRMRCWCEWRWSPDHPPLRWTVERIHARRGQRWVGPVHERLAAPGRAKVADSAVAIRHLRDPAQPRPAYLPLLRQACAERPADGRLAHLRANEARLRGCAEEARSGFHRALGLDVPPNERLHCMLMLSHLEPDARHDWLLRACAQFPHRREPWCELAQAHLDAGRWRAARAVALRALSIDAAADDYLTNPFALGAWPERVAAHAAEQLGLQVEAAHHARRARAPAGVGTADRTGHG